MDTAPVTLSAEEFVRRHDRMRIEFVAGEVLFTPPLASTPDNGPPTHVVIEVRPASAGMAAFYGKIGQHLKAGALAVVLFDEATGKACIYRNDEPPEELPRNEEVKLPGFAVSVRRLFEG